jgi:hypothetical protein
VRATTIRRLIVFGVCALGVSGLYLVPSVALPPEQVGYPSADDNPTVRPGAAATIAAKTPAARAAAGDTRSTRPADEPIEAATGIERTSSAQPAVQQQRRRDASSKRAGATAFDAVDSPDTTAPDPVSGIRFGPVTKDTLTISWAATHDDVSVIGYRIWLNGFEVATTAETHVTVTWFNDDMGQHVVQVRALDAAGNESKTSPNALVNRPTAAPTPTPSPTPTESTPTGSTQPSKSPTDQAGEEPSALQSSTGVR